MSDQLAFLIWKGSCAHLTKSSAPIPKRTALLSTIQPAHDLSLIQSFFADPVTSQILETLQSFSYSDITAPYNSFPVGSKLISSFTLVSCRKPFNSFVIPWASFLNQAIFLLKNPKIRTYEKSSSTNRVNHFAVHMTISFRSIAFWTFASFMSSIIWVQIASLMVQTSDDAISSSMTLRSISSSNWVSGPLALVQFHDTLNLA